MPKDATRSEAIQWCRDNRVKFVAAAPFPPPEGWLWCDPGDDGLYTLSPIFTLTDQGGDITSAEVYPEGNPSVVEPSLEPRSFVPTDHCVYQRQARAFVRCTHTSTLGRIAAVSVCILKHPYKDPRVPAGCTCQERFK